jgi:hypothetical protein
MLPETFGNLEADTVLLFDNQIKELPATMFDNYYHFLYVDFNELQFGSLEPLMGQVTVFFYDPQWFIGEEEMIVASQGQNVNYSIEVSGEDNVYAWYKDNTLLAGQTTNTLNLTNVDDDDAGIYQLKVTNTIVSDLTLESFNIEIIVEESQPWTIMSSYNKINGTYVPENKILLTDILRDEWGFEGIVLSDWGAVNDRVKGIKAGLDIEMPTSNGINDDLIALSIKEGELLEEELDKVVFRILQYVYKCAENREKNKGKLCDYEAHHELAKKAAIGGAVLMKNDDVLPMKEDSNFAETLIEFRSTIGLSILTLL